LISGLVKATCTVLLSTQGSYSKISGIFCNKASLHKQQHMMRALSDGMLPHQEGRLQLGGRHQSKGTAAGEHALSADGYQKIKRRCFPRLEFQWQWTPDAALSLLLRLSILPDSDDNSTDCTGSDEHEMKSKPGSPFDPGKKAATKRTCMVHRGCGPDWQA